MSYGCLRRARSSRRCSISLPSHRATSSSTSARAAGAWRLADGEVRFTQDMQSLSGTLVHPGGRYESATGEVKGDHVRFSAGLNVYSGRIRGDEMSGEASGARSGFWRATRLKD